MKDILVSMRPKQWIKNLFIFAALVFVLEFNNPDKVLLTVWAFVIFFLSSSGVYIINDIVDIKSDQLHPKKRNRPIASGKVSVGRAISVGTILLILSIVGSVYINTFFAFITVGYIALNILYSFVLKHMVIVDVITIAIGFVLRVIAGAVAISVVFSPWLVFCTFFLTLFLAISKRRNELLFSTGTRSVLVQYSLSFLDAMNMIVLPLTLVTYTFYTFSSEHSRLLMLTVPIVLYGMFRYLYVLQRKKTSDDGPIDDLLSDRSLQFAVVLWVVTVLLVLIYQ
jgi:4-hydroxybenzoate polyprenyltransferase